jgi:hypothetical protein
MKKKIKSINIVFLLLGLLLIAISIFSPEYTRHFLYFSIIVMTPVIIVNMIKQRKEDKLKNTKTFEASIYRMLIMSVVLFAFFVITMQNR